MVLATSFAWFVPASLAQDEDVGPQATAPDSDANDPTGAETGDQPQITQRQQGGINLWRLLVSGGVFMLPLVLMSLLTVTFTIERFIALRKNRVLPPGLVRGLGELAGSGKEFDPREAYRLCQRYPSAAANVIRAMLLKVGRPHSEVEHTVREVSQREADRLYGNVRWLVLAAGVSPLLGLLGTVWGLIQAFYDTTQLAPGQNKAEQLAQGIYIALVTTLTGLVVAIPAAIFAHYFEGRLKALFHQVDEMLFHLLPQIERFEGRVRFNRPSGESGAPTPPPQPAVGSKTE